jgi:hypothetical protein
MRNKPFIAIILILLGIGDSAVLGQEPASTSFPALTPKATQKKPTPPRPTRAPAATTPPPPPYQSGEHFQVEPITVKLARGGKVAISSRAGRIALSGWDRDVVQASASSENGPEPIETQTTGDTAHPRLLLIIPASSYRRYGREVKLEIKVPRYADVETLEGNRSDVEISDVDGVTVISAGNGDVAIARVGQLKVSRRSGEVRVKDVKGDFTARSYHGDIVADNVAGTVDVATSNGDLTVHNAGSDVRANSATGDINVRCAKGRAEANSASGSITLVGIGGDAEASTASGEVMFTGTIRSSGSYRLRSISGEVLMTIQADAPGFTATLTTYSGGLETEFPLKVESPVQRGPVNRRLTGTFGDGKAKIALDSFSGLVKIAKGNAVKLKECK